MKGQKKRRKGWLLERDSYQCQFPVFHNGRWGICGAQCDLERHHIETRFSVDPPLYRGAKLRYPVDDPRNLIMVCSRHHRGFGLDHADEYVLHPLPDESLFPAHPWNRRWDKYLLETARVNTERFLPDHPYPFGDGTILFAKSVEGAIGRGNLSFYGGISNLGHRDVQVETLQPWAIMDGAPHPLHQSDASVEFFAECIAPEQEWEVVINLSRNIIEQLTCFWLVASALCQKRIVRHSMYVANISQFGFSDA